MKDSIIETKRIEWLDVIKALGIILVYFGHAHVSGYIYIYMFHMPMFFIISGFCWNEEKNRSMSFKAFAKKKFKAYMIPYFKVAIICFLTVGIAKSLIKYGISDAFSDQIMKYLFGITVFSRGTVEWLPQCSPIWFLSCLFCAEIIFYWIMKTKDYVLPLVLFAGLLGYGCSIIGKYFPWNIDNALSAIPLLYIGIMVKKYQSVILSYWLMPIFLTLTVFAFFHPIIVDFDGNHFSNQFLMYLYGTVITLSIFQVISRLPIGGVFCNLLVNRRLYYLATIMPSIRLSMHRISQRTLGLME